MCDNKFKCPGHEYVGCTDKDEEGLLHCKHCPQEWVPKHELDLEAAFALLKPLLDGKEAKGLIPLLAGLLPIIL